MFIRAVISCFMLLRQVLPRAVSRAAWTAGKSSATSVPMIAITTSSSTNVKPLDGCLITNPFALLRSGVLPPLFRLDDALDT
jgi:hypothetical protein